MRKAPFALVLALVALPGCQLAIPNGLLLPTPASTTPAPVVTSTASAEATAVPAAPPPNGRPAMKPGAGMASGTAMAEADLAFPGRMAPGMAPMGAAPGAPPPSCDADFATLDADGDGGLDMAELVRWPAIANDPGYQGVAPACDTPPAPDQPDASFAPLPAPAPTEDPPVAAEDLPANADDLPAFKDDQVWLPSNEAGATPIPRPSDAFPADACGASKPLRDPAEFFAKADGDQDGRLDPKEFCAFGALWMPSPGDVPPPPGTGGPPGPPDAPPPPPGAPPTIPPPPGACPDDAADHNQDGMVDWGEYFDAHRHEADVMGIDYAHAKEAVYKRFQSRDRNGDQMLDSKERCTP